MCNSEGTHAHTRLQDITGVKAHKHSRVFYSPLFFLFFFKKAHILDDVAELVLPALTCHMSQTAPPPVITSSCGGTNLGFQLFNLVLDVVNVLRVLQAFVRHAPGPLDQVQGQDRHAVRLQDRRTRAKNKNRR